MAHINLVPYSNSLRLSTEMWHYRVKGHNLSKVLRLASGGLAEHAEVILLIVDR
jgi:hypothetical protein